MYIYIHNVGIENHAKYYLAPHIAFWTIQIKPNLCG